MDPEEPEDDPAPVPSKPNSPWRAAFACGLVDVERVRVAFAFSLRGFGVAVTVGAGGRYWRGVEIGSATWTTFSRFLALATFFFGSSACSGFSAMWAMIGGAGSAPVITHAAPAPTPLRHRPTIAAAGPRRPPPVEAAYIEVVTSWRESSRASQPNGSSSANRRDREKRISRTVARQVAQWRRCGRIATTCALVAVPGGERGQRLRVALARLARLDPAEGLQEPRAALGDRAVDLRVGPAEAAPDLLVGQPFGLQQQRPRLVGLERAQRLDRALHALAARDGVVDLAQPAVDALVEVESSRSTESSRARRIAIASCLTTTRSQAPSVAGSSVSIRRR